ncbi:MAG: hypothetical protein M3460_09755 [Actinomycetota bacterium]|jgi:hypothetical protein|nr:hypothetical protein [Actinomycetota bacterium]
MTSPDQINQRSCAHESFATVPGHDYPSPGPVTAYVAAELVERGCEAWRISERSGWYAEIEA